MNPLTEIRDLVYQQRFTESLRLILSCREVGLPYIRTHSGKVNPNRKSNWSDEGLGHNKDYDWGSFCGYGSGNGSNYGYCWSSSDGEGLGGFSPEYEDYTFYMYFFPWKRQ